jgi:hypothetical protein
MLVMSEPLDRQGPYGSKPQLLPIPGPGQPGPLALGGLMVRREFELTTQVVGHLNVSQVGT